MVSHRRVGSVRALSQGTSPTPLATYAYTAFGERTDGTKLLGKTDTNHQFAGEQLDPTGLYYNRARYYNSSYGRFVGRDSFSGSLQEPLSLNRYGYANANPVLYSDPGGMLAEAPTAPPPPVTSVPPTAPPPPVTPAPPVLPAPVPPAMLPWLPLAAAIVGGIMLGLLIACLPATHAFIEELTGKDPCWFLYGCGGSTQTQPAGQAQAQGGSKTGPQPQPQPTQPPQPKQQQKSSCSPILAMLKIGLALKEVDASKWDGDCTGFAFYLAGELKSVNCHGEAIELVTRNLNTKSEKQVGIFTIRNGASSPELVAQGGGRGFHWGVYVDITGLVYDNIRYKPNSRGETERVWLGQLFAYGRDNLLDIKGRYSF